MGCMWPSRKPGTHAGCKKLWGIKILRTYRVARD